MERSNTSERLSGPWRILANASVSNTFRSMLGRARVVSVLSHEYIGVTAGELVVDFGCGLAGILPELTDVRYFGVDVDAAHIKAASARFSDVGSFQQMDLLKVDSEDFETADIILARGFFHHLDDTESDNVVKLAHSILKPNGRLITIDPVRTLGQNPIASLLVNLDRGRHVRDAEGYRAILKDRFNITSLDIRRDLLRVPYSHCITISSPR